MRPLIRVLAPLLVALGLVGFTACQPGPGGAGKAATPGQSAGAPAGGQAGGPPGAAPAATSLSTTGGQVASGGRIVTGVYGELTLVDAEKGTAQPLKIPGQTGGDIIDPTWSPDGRQIAYIRQTAPEPGDAIPLGRAYLRAFDPATNQDRVIREEPNGALLYFPAWAPDGRSLYYTRVEHRFDGPRYLGFQSMIMRIGADGQNPTQVLLDGEAPAPSPDGKQLAFLSREPDVRPPGLYQFDLESKEMTSILPSPAPVELNGPTYSPDGKTIAISASALSGGGGFQTGRAFWEPSVALAHGLPADVWLIAPDGTNLRQVSKLGEDRMLPAWSPDGQAIAALGLSGLYIFAPDGRQLARYDKLGGEGSTTWGRAP